MWRLIKFLFTGDIHLHKWEHIKNIDIHSNGADSMPTAEIYVMQCEHCGNIKKVKIGA
jgi:hypothetical protein